MDKYAASLTGFFKKFDTLFDSSKMQQVVATSIVLVVTKILADQIIKVIKEKYNTYKTSEYFEKMINEHPQLKQYKPEDIAKNWNSLNHFAPTIAKDPLAAGAYLTQTLKKLSGEEFGGPPPDTYATLVDIEKKISEIKKNNTPKSTLFENASKTILNLTS